jgi:glycosyltransferase involved in cell wall biosynthesis
VPSVLYVYSRRVTFTEIDREVLAERYEVRDWYQPGRVTNLFRLVPLVLRSDAVFGWWAHWHTFFPITLAWLLRKPSVLVIGGFDTASKPEIGYGHQRGGLRKHLSRWIMRRATVLVTNSLYSRGEIEANIGDSIAERVRVVHHGVPDRFGEPRTEKRERMALTVGIVDRSNLERKGHRAFVEAAAALPDVAFVLAGREVGDAGDALREDSPPNVQLTGWLEDDDLEDYYRRAAVYVQASEHEGFGLSVAEAMLAGCVPVVSQAGALPEVVDGAGMILEGREASDVADGVRRALEAGPELAHSARERVLREFPLEVRSEGLHQAMEEALAARGK